MGIKFQIKANEEPSEIIIHLRLHDREARSQQECVDFRRQLNACKL